MSLTVLKELEQGTDEWLAARCGIVTASVVGQLITKGAPDALAVECPKCQALAADACISTARKVPTPIKTVHDERVAKAAELPPVYGVAANDTSRGLTATLAAERITGRVLQVFPSRDMERGTLDEPYARDAYSEHYAPATEVGFMVRDDWGLRLGYSPDGLVGNDGLIEIKSRAQKKHLQTILADEVPLENMAQIQCGLLVSGREWLDYVSFCSGMPLWTKRVLPDPRWFTAIIEAVSAFELTATDMIATYLESTAGLPETEYIDHFAEKEITF
jgi:hypothetical protein